MSQKICKCLFCLSLLCTFLLSSCASSIDVKVVRPAELNLNGAKTIAVLPFKPSQFFITNRAFSTSEFILYSMFRIFDGADPDERRCLEYLQSQLESGLSSSSYIKLVNSDAVSRALKNNTQNPADVYLTGEVTYFDIDDSFRKVKVKFRDAQDGHPAVYEIETRWKRQARIDIRYQVIDSKTDHIIAYRNVSYSAETAEYTDRTNLPSAFYMLDSDLYSLSKKILREVQPYTVTKSIKLLSTKSKIKMLKELMKIANDTVDDGNLEDGYRQFRDIYDKYKLVEAGYNAAMIQQALGNLERAESELIDVQEKFPSDSRISKGLSDIRYEIRQAEVLKSQTKSANAN